jgi:hypothetical protein
MMAVAFLDWTTATRAYRGVDGRSSGSPSNGVFQWPFAAPALTPVSNHYVLRLSCRDTLIIKISMTQQLKNDRGVAD